MPSLLPESELRQEFVRRRTRQWLLVIPVFLVILLMQSRGDSGDGTFYGLDSTVAILLGLTIVLGALAFSVYNWRCPACSAYLGRGINPTFCSKCGFKLKA